jgi:hypothetical protein
MLRRLAAHAGQRGSVTAETALALPSVVLALWLVAGVAQVVSGQVQCEDAARAAARLAARGESWEQVRAAATSAGPPGGRVAVEQSGDQVVVRVTATVSLALPGHPGITVDARAAATTETTSLGVADPVGAAG